MIKKLYFLLVCCTILAYSQDKPNTDKYIPAFKLEKNDLELSRLAQPLQYFDKIGKRAGIMGFESGTFEMWVWPWKPLRNFELSFLLGTSTQPILAKDIARTISVTPEATVITYTYESFTVKEIIIVPRDEPGAILLLDVHNNVPLTIVAGFLPVMQPMWPAGIGGQFSYWDDDANAYVISEGQWRTIVLCGSPAGVQMAAPPAHMFADNPIQFKIDVKPGASDGKFIPIIIAGGGDMKMDTVKAIYTRLWKNAAFYYHENYQYYRQLRNSTTQIVTPNNEFNLAYEWGKVALDNLLVTNPHLGTGLVAGFGLSGGGARPGFAWFFGGDAFINSLSFDSYGATSTVRDALEFTQKWQRQDNFPIRKKKPGDAPKDVGKMAHELSQSDGLVDWWNDYHYGYNHADTTPWYLVAMGDYVRTSGDIDFLKKSWSSVKQAYQWCLSKDSDGDGLMDLKGAGLGALEFGKLVGIYSDVYTCGVFVQGIKEVIMMADLVKDMETKAQAQEQLVKANKAMEKIFWMEKEGFYTYGATEKGEQVKERSPWVGTAFMFSLLNKDHTEQSLELMNGADLCSDWGTRSLSPFSSLFDPTNYNYGAAWPFISSFFATAQFKYHYNLAGYSSVESVVKHVFDNALGEVPEVFSGDINQKLAEGYHHQGFSTTGYMLPYVRGLIGLEVDALHNQVSLSPHLPPNWDSVVINHVSIANRVYNFKINQAEDGISVQMFTAESKPCSVKFTPDFPPGTIPLRASIGSVPINDFSPTFCSVVHEMSNNDRIEIFCKPSVAILPPTLQTAPGATNYSIKVISEKVDPSDSKLLRLLVEGKGGESYQLNLLRADQIVSIHGATLDGSHLNIQFEVKDKQDFIKKEIAIKLK
ncbi:MAG: amylo-alpha-1,6-glucosidase [Bacteroidota bacterium]